MRQKHNSESTECIAQIAPLVKKIINVVGEQYVEEEKWLSILEEKI